MTTRVVGLGVAVCGVLLGCSGEVGHGDDLGRTAQAFSVCDETVPPERFIDGFPAYAQCPASENSSIYSNNGLDTSLTSMGADWIRTQSSGGYQCTELAHRYLHFKWGVTWTPRGNAGTWCDTVPPDTSGVVQTMTPVHGDIIVLAPGSCGADGTTGHVAVVDTVEASRLFAVQQNSASRGRYALTCAKCYLHVVANDGGVVVPGTGGAPPVQGTGGAPPVQGTGGAPPSPPPGAGGSWPFPPPPSGGSPSMGPENTGGTPAVTPSWPPASGNGGASGTPVGGPAGFSGNYTFGPAPQPADTSSSSGDSGSCRVSAPGRVAHDDGAALLLLAMASLVKRRRITA